MSGFQVSPAERIGNPLWGRLKTHLEKRLAYLRSQNDGALTPEQTAWVRGQIAEVKALLNADKDVPVVKTPDIDEF